MITDTLQSCLAERTAQRDQLNAAIDAISKLDLSPPVATRNPPAQPPPRARRPRPRAVENSPPSTPTPRPRPGAETLAKAMRDVVATLDEPFNVIDVTAAVLEARPEMKKRMNDGAVAGNLRYWQAKGELAIAEKGTPGNPTKFSRTAIYGNARTNREGFHRNGIKFGKRDPKPSAKEAAYAEFRKGVNIPAPDHDPEPEPR